MGEVASNTTNKDMSGFEIIEFTIDYPDKNGQLKKQFFGISVAKILSILNAFVMNKGISISAH